MMYYYITLLLYKFNHSDIAPRVHVLFKRVYPMTAENFRCKRVETGQNEIGKEKKVS